MSRMLQALKQIDKKKPIRSRSHGLVDKSRLAPSDEPSKTERPEPKLIKQETTIKVPPPTTILTRSIDSLDSLPGVIDDINRVIEEANKLSDTSLPQWDPQTDIQWVGVPTANINQLPSKTPVSPETTHLESVASQASDEPPLVVEVPDTEHESDGALEKEQLPAASNQAVPESATTASSAEPHFQSRQEPDSTALSNTTDEETQSVESSLLKKIKTYNPTTNNPASQSRLEQTDQSFDPSDAYQPLNDLDTSKTEHQSPDPRTSVAPVDNLLPAQEASKEDFPFSPGQLDPWKSNRQREANDYERRVKDDLKDGPIAAQYRRIVDSIRSQQPGNAPYTIFFSAAHKEPHVADIASHIAALLAGGGLGEVLLIDANLSGSILSKQFDASDKEGIGELINGRAVLTNSIHATAIDHFSLLPHGITSISTRNLSVAKVAQLLNETKQQFQYVLVASDENDSELSQAFSRACDAVYLLIHLGLTQSSDAATTVHKLQSSGARMLGCIVTNSAVQS